MLVMDTFGSRLQLIERLGADRVGQDRIVATRHRQ
jgi:hypothetical protein